MSKNAPAKVVNLVETMNEQGSSTVRMSDDDLHRAVRQMFWDGHHIVFERLPTVLDRIIKHEIWRSRTRNFKSFGEYALDQTSEGLGIKNNYMLWLLRCSLDVHGRHVKEWAEVLEQVEQMVRVTAKEEGTKVRELDGNSLESLGKEWAHGHTNEKITYLPSRNSKLDGNLMRLRKNAPEVYERVTSGDMSIREGLREAGMQRKDSDINRDPVDRAIMYIKRMKKADVERFLQRLSEEGYL